MKQETKRIFWFTLNFLLLCLLAVSQNKIAELIHLSPASTIVSFVVILVAALLAGIKLFRAERESPTSDDKDATSEPKATLWDVQWRYLEIFICGLSAMAGALIWYGFGVIGSYVGLPLMVLIPYIFRRTPFIKRGFLKESLMFGTFSAMFGHFLIFCAAVVIAVRGGGLYMDENGVEVLPLMRTMAGMLVAVAAGVVVAVFVMIPVKEGQD